ncbi:extracellular solute-binding protein, family 3 [Roseibium hamelinense]|uniref:Extracellular solute-binding protein, family 3 n=1 Tax=Roseibium hamelinense TaxID=150831 RepID=A0A562TI99_9HYPH|nr:amino acid ABC transporter substrate-binding protein [Roseibium hamelinense]MTI42619.1 hypothetical protein [Roseibium hamelinense]TWI93365.1 extracellular solute-binding protein, family 3 [Roseibium hamelinense]
MTCFKIAVACMAFLAVLTSDILAKDVRYPVEPGRRDVEDNFAFQVLKLALERSGGDWNLVPSEKGAMNENRAKLLIRRGAGVDVGWYGTYAALEKELMPVRIPIDGGLLGWRLFLIDGVRQSEFDKIQTLDDLRQLTLVQGDGWGDIAILEAAGMKVDTGPYSDLFTLVGAGRADAFPRGVNEAFAEHENRVAEVPNLAIEQGIVVYYRYPMLFFVRNGNQELHDAIYGGLERAYADGSYRELFEHHPDNKVSLTTANLNNRRKFEIPNPYLSHETASIPEKYWFMPKN